MKFIIPKEEKKEICIAKYVAIGVGIVLAIAGIFFLIKKLTKKRPICEDICDCDDDCCCDDDECCCCCDDPEEEIIVETDGDTL